MPAKAKQTETPLTTDERVAELEKTTERIFEEAVGRNGFLDIMEKVTLKLENLTLRVLNLEKPREPRD